jgi:hypothetical protein
MTGLHTGFPQPGVPDPRICIPQLQGGPVTPPDTWFISTRRVTLQVFEPYFTRACTNGSIYVPHGVRGLSPTCPPHPADLHSFRISLYLLPLEDHRFNVFYGLFRKSLPAPGLPKPSSCCPENTCIPDLEGTLLMWTKQIISKRTPQIMNMSVAHFV